MSARRKPPQPPAWSPTIKFRSPDLRPYAAKLLFQWRSVRPGRVAKKRRLCEERIVLFVARSDSLALTRAKKIALSAQFDHPVSNGPGHVYFEFVGVVTIDSVNPSHDG